MEARVCTSFLICSSRFGLGLLELLLAGMGDSMIPNGQRLVRVEIGQEEREPRGRRRDSFCRNRLLTVILIQ